MPASSTAIRASRAFVELLVDDSQLVRGLRAAQKKLQAFGAAVQSLGKGLFGIGAGLAAPLATASKLFADAGSDLVDMSQRTGASVDALSELGYAAEQSGSDLTTLEGGLRKMQKAVVAAAEGSDSAQQTFRQLGLSASDLAHLSPDQQFELIADRLAKIPNPAHKAALAMEVFGKTGTSLLPLMANGAAGIFELRQEAQALGLVMSTEDAQAAEAFGDTLDTVWKVLRMGVIQIGTAVEPILSDLAQTIIRVSVTAANWIKENRQLIATVFKIALGVAAAGAALFVLGTLISGIGSAIGLLASLAVGFGTALGVIGTILGALLSPVGAVTAGIVALGAYLLYVSGAGSAALDWLGRQFAALQAEALGAFQGISDALAAGDLALAARILWLTLKLQWQKGINALNTLWLNVKAFFVSVWTEADYNVAAIATNAWAGLQTGWTETVDFLADVWSLFTTSLIQGWHSTIGFIRKAWVRLKSLFDEDVNVEAEVARIHDEVAGQNAAATEARDQSIFSREKARRQRLSQIEQGRTGTLDELERMRESEQDRHRQQFEADVKESDAALAAARKEWQAALETAAEKRSAVEGDAASRPDRRKELNDLLAQAGDGLDGAAAKVSVSGTFNAAAAVRGLGGGTHGERIAKATEETARNTKRLLDEAHHGGLQFT
jgi:hypothetical protein